jgi:hypothetical protein
MSLRGVEVALTQSQVPEDEISRMDVIALSATPARSPSWRGALRRGFVEKALGQRGRELRLASPQLSPSLPPDELKAMLHMTMFV